MLKLGLGFGTLKPGSVIPYTPPIPQSGLTTWLEGDTVSGSNWVNNGSGANPSLIGGSLRTNTRTLNGQPVVTFLSDTVFSLDSGMNPSTDDFTIFMVAMTDDGTNDCPWSYGTNELRMYANTTDFLYIIGGGYSGTNLVDTAKVPFLTTVAHDSTQTAVRYNQAVDSTSVNTFTTNSTTIYLGGRTNAVDSDSWNGYIAAFILYDRKLDSDEITQVEEYLAAKYKVADYAYSAMNLSGAGQSNMANYFAVSGETETETELANTFTTPDFINGATSGSALIKSNDDGSGYWYDPDTSTFGGAYDTWATSVSGKTIHAIIWDQGESDREAGDSTAKRAEYKAGLIALFNKMRSVVGNVPILIVPLSREDNTFAWDDGYEAVRRTQIELASEYDWIGLTPEKYDLAMADNLHLTSASYDVQAVRNARKVSHFMGYAVTGNLDGPKINAVSRIGTFVGMQIDHDAGTDFTPTTDINGFRFFDDGVEIPITSASRTGADTISLVLSSTPSGTETLVYGYGAMTTTDVDYTKLVVDNEATYPLPLHAAR